MKRTLLLPLLPAIAWTACTGCAAGPEPGSAMTDLDVHSYARPAEVRTRHIDLDLTLDFDTNIARGQVTHHLVRRNRHAPFVVDTQDLAIAAVTDAAGRPLSHELATADPHLGRRLTILLGHDTTAVTIRYRTAPEAAAMQWLGPEQTSGQKLPFLFTQGQAILTRSWIPLQDSPAVRITWNARITAPTGMTTVMSAVEREVDGETTTFRMDKPVPSYLIALACGDLASSDISGRCAVWAEPAVLPRAAAELSDMEAMVVACEELFGPYRWGRYDLLVLPPAFPFGGMENPCLTFATPTILAGDKSLVALVAHELAHSWSGNLVTNATWRDFWLNEGFTVYLEQRIMERLYGRDRATMEIALGMQGLAAELEELPPPDQILHIDLTGRNPDDGMTAVAYDKGAAFLRRLEQVYGRETLDAFLRSWFDQHAFQSVTTAEFLAFLEAELLAKGGGEGTVDIVRWVRGIGLPADAPIPESTLFAAVDTERDRFRAGAASSELRTDGWVTQQWLRFLADLDPVTPERLAELDKTFQFTRSGNSEILAAWMALAVRRGYRGVDRRLDLFLMTVGRRKFLKPLYEALLAAENGKARALAVYRRARPRYHAVSQRTLDAMLDYRP
ncbi:MAG: M1 family metallopeptidase [bacterium]|nr:M1 family metallopeptidase [bacterium]